MAISELDRRILDRCEEVKEASHDPHRKVGVVIADGEGTELATGTNAPPAKLGLALSDTHTEISRDPNWKYFLLEHAERNAINSARDQGISIQGATMYGTLFPCADCARAIVSAGISRLVVPGPGGNPQRDEKWLQHYQYAHKIFDLAGVVVDIAPAEDAATGAAINS
jgi:dCMP deaminase